MKKKKQKTRLDILRDVMLKWNDVIKVKIDSKKKNNRYKILNVK